MLNFFRPHVRATNGFDSIKTLDGMKFLLLSTSLLVIQPCRKVRSVWMVGLEFFSRILMHLYMVMASRYVFKPLYTRKHMMGMSLSMIPSWGMFVFLKGGRTGC